MSGQAPFPVARLASALLAAHRDAAHPPARLPEALHPRSEADSYATQGAVMAELGGIGGWKVGAPRPDGPITCAPMPRAGLHESPARLFSARHTNRVTEAEIGFRLGRDLPARDAPYEAAELWAAVESCHPGIEVLQSRLHPEDAHDALLNLADGIAHGAYVVGPALADWRTVEWSRECGRIELDGVERARHVGNPGGEAARLLLWLANHGARWAGGLRAGQLLTTGSWTGKLHAGPASTVRARFDAAGEASLDFVIA